MSDVTHEPTPPATAAVPIAVFGTDEAGKPHASRFTGEEAELATKAAGLMNMHVVPLAGPECAALAERLPQGRVFASGRAFVPFCKKPLYDALAAIGGVPPSAAIAKPAKAKAAVSGKAGRQANGGVAAEAKAAKRANATGRSTGAGGGEPVPSRPTHWNLIKSGSLVLATTGESEGWYEAIIEEDKGDDLMLLRWRDWPDDSPFLRRRYQLALLPPGAAANG